VCNRSQSEIELIACSLPRQRFGTSKYSWRAFMTGSRSSFFVFKTGVGKRGEIFVVIGLIIDFVASSVFHFTFLLEVNTVLAKHKKINKLTVYASHHIQ
jgi:hypothetical protein